MLALQPKTFLVAFSHAEDIFHLHYCSIFSFHYLICYGVYGSIIVLLWYNELMIYANIFIKFVEFFGCIFCTIIRPYNLDPTFTLIFNHGFISLEHISNIIFVSDKINPAKSCEVINK